MIPFEDYDMDEARKNPALNPRIPAYQQLIDKGYNTKDYFLTFTNMKKVGINPTSQHETPNGIYTFPATEILEMVHGTMGNAPYVGNAPYIHVLKRRGGGIVDPIESYSTSDFKKDMKKIYKIVAETKRKSLPMNPDGKKHVRDVMDRGEKNSFRKTPISMFWNVTRAVSADADIARYMGWGGVKSRKGKKGVSYNAQGWNNLLRQLGYQGFVDRNGTGTIHKNEPMQAVFMSMKSLKVVEMIENKSYAGFERQDDIKEYVDKLKKYNEVTIVGNMDVYYTSILKELSEAYIVGCKIEFYKGVFYISGDGEISDFESHGDEVRLDDVTIHSGRFINMRYIKNCIIMGAVFIDSVIDKCEIIGGGFQSCKFKDILTSNNANFKQCVLQDMMFLNCDMEQVRLIDCGLAGRYQAKLCTLRSAGKQQILSSKDGYYIECNITNANINEGSFYKCTIDVSNIKGGSFREGIIDNSILKDGKFRGVKIRESDMQGGDIT